MAFSFLIPNPPSPLPPSQPRVKFVGNSIAYGGPQTILECITTPGCEGVQSGSVSPAIVSAQAYEASRFAGFDNRIAFFIRANVGLQQTGSIISISGFFGNYHEAGSQTLLLDACPGALSRAAFCNTSTRCNIFLDSSLPPGTIMMSSVVDVTIACSDIAPGQVL